MKKDKTPRCKIKQGSRKLVRGKNIQLIAPEMHGGFHIWPNTQDS